MNADELQRLVQSVQANCDRADARHAGELTMCSYLLQMREFFRWERGLPLTAALPHAEIGDWIAGREARWDVLANEPYAAVDLPGGRFDPFDAESIGRQLWSLGWVYGAGRVGLQGGGRAVFFLAQRHATCHRGGLLVLQAGAEKARGLLAPPAALAGNGEGPIIIRREALARWCWQGYEAWTMHRREAGAWHAVVQAYGLDDGFKDALPRWLDDLVEISLLHELGEHAFAQQEQGARGRDWTRLRTALPDARSERQAVAVRDLLADLRLTLPTLLHRAEPAPLHAWFASFDGLRAALFPRLTVARQAWHAGQGLDVLRDAVTAGQAHFEALASGLLEILAAGGPEAGPELARQLAHPSAICDR